RCYLSEMARHRRGGQPDRRLDLRLSSVPFAEVEESDRQDTDPGWLSSPRSRLRRCAGRRERNLLYGEDRVSRRRLRAEHFSRRTPSPSLSFESKNEDNKPEWSGSRHV